MAGFGAARGAAIAAALALAVACGGTTVETSTRGDQSTGGPRATQAASAERSAAPSADAGPPAALARWAFDVARQSADDPGADLSAEAVATTRHAALAAADGGWVD
ncbi:MAG: hypothetical protein QOG49_480, partial [Frankiaceae bacterium]|nr:hypothetical protein [Frankiaceae bacterium]